MAQIIPLNSNFERITSRQKKYREVVVIVHHYGGNKHSFDHHVKWLNELGFDVITFDLPARNLATLKHLPISREWGLGLRHLWADKIEEVLGSLGEQKFIYSFSFPSVSVLSALARRHAIDVRGWVTEGGPFKRVPDGVRHLIKSNAWHSVITDENSGQSKDRKWQVLKWSVDKFSLVQKALIDITALTFGTSNYDRDVDTALKALPKGFPVLSLRGEKDTLVTSDQIDQFFAAGFGQIDLTRFMLPHSGHLQGLRSDHEIYEQIVGSFLTSKATLI